MGEKIEFCKGGGCTAKLGAGLLNHVLEKLPKGKTDNNLLIGYDSKDDAAVYRISDDTAIVQTLDFFPPMVEDPYLLCNGRRSENSIEHSMFPGADGFEYSG